MIIESPLVITPYLNHSLRVLYPHLLDPTSSGRVVMDYVMKFVTPALEWSYVVGEADVRAETLEAAAELLTVRRDAIRVIDGAGPVVEVHPPEQEQGSVIGAEPGVEPAPSPPKRGRKKTAENVGGNVEAEVKALSQADAEASSEQVDAGSPVLPTKPKRPKHVGEPKPKRYAVGEQMP